jgi:hypothetical protein
MPTPGDSHGPGSMAVTGQIPMATHHVSRLARERAADGPGSQQPIMFTKLSPPVRRFRPASWHGLARSPSSRPGTHGCADGNQLIQPSGSG